METISEQAAILRERWETDPRWAGVERTYSAEDVIRLRGSVVEEHTRARLGAARLWDLLRNQAAIRALGATSASQAAQTVSAGAQAIFMSGWRTATDGDLAPVVADAEAGSGDVLNAFELMTAMIEAGAAGLCLEDRLPSGTMGGNLGGKVLIPTGQHIEALSAARLAADVLDVPALVIARTAAAAATLLTSDADERDHEFLTGGQTAEGLHQVRPSLYACVTRGLAYAPYADLLWLETPAPDLPVARAFAQIIHSQYPDKMLAYSCSPSCNWREQLDDADIATFQKELAAIGYRFQLIGPASVPRQDADLGASLEPAHFVGHDQVDHHGRLVPAD